ADMYLPKNEAVAEADAVGVIELALAATMAAEPIDAKIRAAQKAGKINGQDAAQLARHACESGLISRAELSLLERRAVLRDKVIRVDDFPQDFALEQQQPLPERAAA
ncbi:MAG: acyl-CoA dehydrogenase domain-containing protein, partial [Pseudomonadota bacterium]